jgi:hypothetical protein
MGGGSRVIAPSFLTSTLVGGEWSASHPGRFTAEEMSPGTLSVGGWVGPRTSLDIMEKKKTSYNYPELNCDPSGFTSRNIVAIPTELSRLIIWINIKKNFLNIFFEILYFQLHHMNIFNARNSCTQTVARTYLFCLTDAGFSVSLQALSVWNYSFHLYSVWRCRELLTILRSRMPSNVARNLLENLGSSIAAPHTRRCTRRSTTTSTAALALSLLRSPPATEMSAQFVLTTQPTALLALRAMLEAAPGWMFVEL